MPTEVENMEPKEIPFQLEYDNARAAAANFAVGKAGPFRSSISKACHQTYEGERSIDGFVKFVTALVKDEEKHFQIPLLSVQTLFLNSLKSEDIDLEVVRELKDKNVEFLSEYTRKNENLIKMVNGLVVNKLSTNNNNISDESFRSLKLLALAFVKCTFPVSY